MLYWRRSVSVADLNVILISDPIRVSKVLSKEKLHSSSLVGSGIRVVSCGIKTTITLVAMHTIAWPQS